MFPAVLLAIGIASCQAKDYVTSTYSKTYVKTSKVSMKFKLEMDSSANTVSMTLIGPSDVWYSVGFGSYEMASTYCIVVDGDGDVSERYLIKKTAGNELDFTWNIVSNTVSDSTRTVVLSRDYDYDVPTSYHTQFTTGSSKLKTIWAYGTSSDLDGHGEDKRGDAKLKATRSTSTIVSNNEAKLYGEMAGELIEEEYEAYTTTSSVITWVTCVAAFGMLGYYFYRRWLAKQAYESIPDSISKSQISMVRVGSSMEKEEDDEMIRIVEVDGSDGMLW